MVTAGGGCGRAATPPGPRASSPQGSGRPPGTGWPGCPPGGGTCWACSRCWAARRRRRCWPPRAAPACIPRWTPWKGWAAPGWPARARRAGHPATSWSARRSPPRCAPPKPPGATRFSPRRWRNPALTRPRPRATWPPAATTTAPPWRTRPPPAASLTGSATARPCGWPGPACRLTRSAAPGRRCWRRAGRPAAAPASSPRPAPTSPPRWTAWTIPPPGPGSWPSWPSWTPGPPTRPAAASWPNWRSPKPATSPPPWARPWRRARSST